mgnify:CR=1 FL=1
MAKNAAAIAEKPVRKSIPTKIVGEAPSKAKPVTVTIRARSKQGLRLVVWNDYEAVLTAVDAAVQPSALAAK